MITYSKLIWSINKAVSEQGETVSSLEDKILKLEKIKTELLMGEQLHTKRIEELEKQKKAATKEIMLLNSKLQKLSSKVTSFTDISHNDDNSMIEEAKTPETPDSENQFEKAFQKSSRLLNRLKKSIEEIYKDFINLLIHAEETNSSCKKLVYDLERRINELKISINDHFDDISISNEKKSQAKRKGSRTSVLSQAV